MATIATPKQNPTNSNYLITALTPVYQELINYAQRQQGQEVEEKPINVTQELEAISTSLPPLEKLCQTFTLYTFERNILLLSLCRVVFPDAPYWFTQAQGNPRMDYPTLGLALQIWPDNHWNAITPTAPLRSWQLLLVDTNQEDLTLAPLKVDESILHYLMAENYHDKQLARFLKPLVTTKPNLPQSHGEIVTNIIDLWSNSSAYNQIPIVQLCGYSISASEEIAASACYEYGHPLDYLSASRLPNNPEELLFLLQRWHRQVKLIDGVLLLDCHNFNQTDAAREEAITRLVEDIETPLIVCSEKRENWPRRDAIAFDIPRLNHDEQLALWQTNLGKVTSKLNGTVESLVTNFNLSSTKIKAACLTTVEEEREKAPLAEKLWHFCRTQARPQLDDLAQRVESKASWEDLILPEKIKTVLQQLASQVRQRAKVYQKWGLASGSGRGLGVSALFAGESGTGKTLAAEVLANEFKLDLYRIDLSRVVSKYIGETEKNLDRIFNAAEGGGVVLLFDEADALFGKRTQVKDSHDRHANVEVSFLLQRMEAYQGLAILTTNLKDSLDQAFMRRLRFIVSFPFPDAGSRSQIWQRMYPQQTPTKGLEYECLGQLSMTGGSIRNIALNAAFLAAEDEGAVMMKHILAATKAEAMKVGKILTERETAGWLV